MEFDLTPATPAKDRRVRRSRAALTKAAVALVTERETAAIPVSDLAAAADVSRQVVYQHFGDRDALLLEAALDLARTELVPQLAEARSADTQGRGLALAVARHFAEHRVFYRAMLNSSSAFALNRALSGLLVPVNQRAMREHLAADVNPQHLEDLARFMTGGAASIVNEWVTEADDPLDPEGLADRLVAVTDIVAATLRQGAATTKESNR